MLEQNVYNINKKKQKMLKNNIFHVLPRPSSAGSNPRSLCEVEGIDADVNKNTSSDASGNSFDEHAEASRFQPFNSRPNSSRPNSWGGLGTAATSMSARLTPNRMNIASLADSLR